MYEKYKGHTPGPWKIEIEGDCDGDSKLDGRGFIDYVVLDVNGKELARFQDKPTALLFKDAPKLLEQNKRMVDALKTFMWATMGFENMALGLFRDDVKSLMTEIMGDETPEYLTIEDDK